MRRRSDLGPSRLLPPALTALLLAGCRSGAPAPALPDPGGPGLAVATKLPGSGYRVAYGTADVATLVVGLFDRGTAAPALGYFYSPGRSATNPLSADAFAALRGAVGSQVDTGSADKTAPRRWLFRTVANPGASPPAINLTGFPGPGSSRRYNLFAGALDGYDNLIGFAEEDLTDAMLAAGTASLALSLDRGGLGALSLGSTITGSASNPLEDLSGLLVGVFDTGSEPRLGRVASGSGSQSFGGTEGWFAALQTFLSDQGLSDVADTRRYCIRYFPATVSGGAMATSLWNLAPGAGYRPFILAVRSGTTDVGHLLGATATVSAAATLSVSLGEFTTQ